MLMLWPLPSYLRWSFCLPKYSQQQRTRKQTCHQCGYRGRRPCHHQSCQPCRRHCHRYHTKNKYSCNHSWQILHFPDAVGGVPIMCRHLGIEIFSPLLILLVHVMSLMHVWTAHVLWACHMSKYLGCPLPILLDMSLCATSRVDLIQ